MLKVDWPPAEKRRLIGKRIDRLDGPEKTTGTAKYSYDINRPGMLYAKLVTSPHAKASIVSVNPSAAKALAGVEAVWVDEDLKDVFYVGQIVAAVAARTEEIAEEAARLVQVEYRPQAHQVVDSDAKIFDSGKDRPAKRDQGNVDDAFTKADKIIEGEYGLPVITHCCLESHGQVAEVRNGEMFIWPSTQAVSGYADRSISDEVEIEQNKIHVDCQYMGGGFGSKFNPGKWGTIGAVLAKQTGKPVKLMLDRDLELMIAGNRPSGYAKIKVGAMKDGSITAMEAEVWGTSGMGGGIPDTIPYVFNKIPHTRRTAKRILTNRGSAAAWRAPNHPQQCFLTMSALADTAAALGLDELDFFLKNLELTDRPEVYREELKIAADLIGYQKKAHLRDTRAAGPVRRGLGVSIHTWGGRGHASNCDVILRPDGSVEAQIGSQDLGVGTRTVIAIVVAETLGLPLEAIHVELGRNSYPNSGASGGSTTIGGVTISSRKAATAALEALFHVVAPKMGTSPESLEVENGAIYETGKAANRITWKEACSLLGVNAITKRGTSDPAESQKAGLISDGVGGVQIADVSVDIDTGVVTMNEMVAVQDCGLIIDLKTAESQVFGAMIMGITYSLFEEAVYDARTGRMLNADMEYYRLAGIKDVGQLKVHMMTGKGYDDRGVIGLGEPPVISPGAAIANAVANACGLRVPYLPLTPNRVISALEKGGVL